MPTLTIKLTHEQHTMLTWLAQQAEPPLSLAQLLHDFLADLACTSLSGGSDERERAFDWYKRRGYAGYTGAITAETWRLSRTADGGDHDN